MSPLPIGKRQLYGYLLVLGSVTVLVFLLVVGLLSANGVEASESKPAQQTGERTIDQFLYFGDAFHATFLQPTVAHKEWTPQQWSNEFSRLRQLGTRSLIIQWSQYDNTAFYAESGEQDSLLHRVTKGAADNDIGFYIGLALNRDWSEIQGLDSGKIGTALKESKRVARIIYQQFGQNPGFRGWYIPQELTDVDYTDDQHKLILNFFANLTATLRGFDPLKPVVASGYTSPERSHVVRFTMWWTRVFDNSGIDILIFQDSAGTSDQVKWMNIEPYLEAISIIDDEFVSTSIWFLAEIFTQVDGPPINGKPFRAEPADFDRVARQIEMLGRFDKKLASYAYFPYMRPTAGESASRLYDRYREFIERRAASNKAAVDGNYYMQQPDIVTNGYFKLGEQHRILATPQPWETSAPHTLSVVERNAGGYRYWGYYGLQDGNGGVGLARSNDLRNWEKYAGNPLFENGRWPSVIRAGQKEMMMVTRDYAQTSRIVLYSSNDGLQFSKVSDIVAPREGERNQNPNLYLDRSTGQYYLYWYSGGGALGGSQIRVRVANHPQDLAGRSSERTLFDVPYVMAAPNIFQHADHYYLATEVLRDVWKTRIYKGASPLGPFRLLAGNPILDNGAACLFQHQFDDKIHVYYCKLSHGRWSMAYRNAALRAMLPEGADQTKSP